MAEDEGRGPSTYFADGPFDDPPERRRIRYAINDMRMVRGVVVGTRQTVKALSITIAGAGAAGAGIAELWHLLSPLFQHQ